MKLGLGNSTGKGTLSQPGIVSDNLETFLKNNSGLPEKISEGSLSLDGSNDNLSCNATVTGATKLTIACWIKHYDTDEIPILTKGAYNHNDGEFHLKLSSNRISFSVRQQFEYWNDKIEDFNVWNHIAIAWDSDAGTTKLYINGSVADGAGGTGGTYAAVVGSNSMFIGRNTSTGSTYGKANIANMGLWVNRALTEAEIKSVMHKNYSALSSAETESLHRWWALDNSYTVVDPSPATKTKDSVSESVGDLNSGASIDLLDYPKKWRGIDSSGNNHHSQLYTGRALEFDGVTDYLDLGTDTQFIDFSAETEQSKRAWTVACWINFDEAKANHQAVCGGGGSIVNYLCLGATEKLAIYDIDNSSWRYANTVLNPKTWYRAVWAFNGDAEITFYVNGVADGTGVIGTTDNDNSDLELRYVGVWAPAQADPRYWEGKMCNFQAWQGAWTADDVAFDYANPEKTILNRGGTSLTESNLKLWYPMNDGYEGQKACIFDAANTGLGPNLVTDGDLSSGTTSNFTNSNGASTFEISTDRSYVGNYSMHIADATAYRGLYQNISTDLIKGKTYKISARVWVVSGSVRMEPADGISDDNTHVMSTTTGEWELLECYFTVDTESTETIYLARTGTSPSEFYVDDMKLEIVNDKHHATTVMYGDELLANTGFETDVSNWSSSGSLTSGPTHNTSHAKVGAESLSFVASAAEGGVKTAKYATVTGRRYRMSFWAKPLNSETKIRQVIMEGDGSGWINASDITLSGLDTDTGAVGSGNWYYIEYDYTEASGGSDAELRILSASDDADGTFAIDEVSVKEIGAASGWTDADQQIEIPQTGLQSYNELAFGRGDKTLTNGFGVKKTDVASSTFMGLTEGSVSAWVFLNEKEDVCLWHMNQKGAGTTDYLRSYFSQSTGKIDIVQEKSNVVQFSYNLDLDTYWASNKYLKKWMHLVWSNDNTTAVPKIYLNGEDATLFEVTNTDKSGWSDFTTDGDTNDFSFMGGGWANVINGCMTEVSCWNKQLTQAEVNELYNGGKAANALTHSASGNLKGYWRNEGITKNWPNLYSPGVNTMHLQNQAQASIVLQQAGVDSSRDCQGFLMNRKRDTNCLNFYDDKTTSISQGPLVKSGNPLTEADFETFTVSMWVKLESNSRANQPLINIIYDNANHFTAMTHSDNKIYFSYETNSTLERYKTTTTDLLTVGEWVHVAFVCKIAESTATDRVKVYVDGKFRVSTTSQTTTTSSPSNRDSMWIGCEKVKGTKLVGQIDDVAVYNKVLTDGLTSPSDGDVAKGEISRNYKAGKRSHK